MDGGMAPSEPATPSSPPLPPPPFNPGQVLGGLGQGILGLGTRAFFNQTPQQVGQDFSSLGSAVRPQVNSFGSGLPQFGEDFLSSINPVSRLQSAFPGLPIQQSISNYQQSVVQPAQQGDYGDSALKALLGGPTSQLTASMGQGFTQGAANLAQLTAPKQGGYGNEFGLAAPVVEQPVSGVHNLAVLGEGIGQVAQDNPKISNELVDAFREGFSPQGSTINPLDDAHGKAAIQHVLNAANYVTNDLLTPGQFHQIIHDGLIGQGRTEDEANQTADTYSQVLSTLAQMAVPVGGEAKIAQLFLLQFAMQFASDPGGTLNAAKQSGGNFFELLGATANHIFRGGPAPTQQEIRDGLQGGVQSLGTLAIGHSAVHGGLGVASKVASSASRKLAGRAVDKLQAKAVGQDNPAADANDLLAQGMAQANNPAPEPTSTAINFGSDLQAPQYAALRTAIAEGTNFNDEEFAQHAQEMGSEVSPPGTDPTQRSRTGFLLKDGTYVALPNYTDGYRQPGRLLEDAGYLDKQANIPETTQVNRFLKDSGALMEQGGTEFASYGLSKAHQDAIIRSVAPFSNVDDMGVYVEDVKAGKSYAIDMHTIVNSGYDLAKAMSDPETRVYNIQGVDDYGPEDLRKTSTPGQAGQTDQIGSSRQASQVGTTEAANRTGEGGQGSGAAIAAEEQTNSGLQGANVPESNARPAPTAVGQWTSHPELINNGLQLFARSGLNNDGLISTVSRDNDNSRYGGWNPGSPRDVSVAAISREDIKNLLYEWHAMISDAQHEVNEIKDPNLRNQRNQVLKSHRDSIPSLRDKTPAVFQAEIMAHEAIHAAISHVVRFDESYNQSDKYPDGTWPEDKGPGRDWQAVMGIRMLDALSSSKEGSAWLKDIISKGHLPWQIDRLAKLSKALSDSGIDPKGQSESIEKWISSYPDNGMARNWSTAGSELFEHLTQQILIGHDLAHVPYSRQGGVNAESKTFWDPQGTAENADIAKSWWDANRYSKSPDLLANSSEPATVSGESAAAAKRPASGEPRQGATDQGSLEGVNEQLRKETVDKWQKSLSETTQRLADMESGKRLSNPSAIAQARMNIDLLNSKLDYLDKNPNESIDAANRHADAELKTRNASYFETPQVHGSEMYPSPPPSVVTAGRSPEETKAPAPEEQSRGKQITPEVAEQAVKDLAQARQARAEAKKQTTPPERRSKTLAEINALRPSPAHMSDPRLTDGDRAKLSRYAMGQINRLQREYEKADAAGNTERAAKLATEKLGNMIAWNNFFKELLKEEPKTYVTVKAPKPLDYFSEAAKVANYSTNHSLAPLKDLAADFTKASQAFDVAKASGVNATELGQLQAQMQWAMTRFRSAYDLYNSRVFKQNIDKQDYSWGGTRSIARRVVDSRASAPEQARMAASLIGKELMGRTDKNPYSLHEAGLDLIKTSMGLSKVAKNWHPELKKVLAGELWRVARQAWQEDPTLPLGNKNIPVHELAHEPDIAELKQSVSDIQSKINQGVTEHKALRERAKKLEDTGRIAKGTVAGMDKVHKQQMLALSNERLRLQSTIDNHVLTPQTRLINHATLTPEDIQAVMNPTVEKAQAAIGENPNADKSIQQIIEEGEAVNQAITQKVPDPFGIDSFLDEGKSVKDLVNEGGGGEPPDGTDPPNNGQPWFSGEYFKAITDMREYGGNYKLVADLTDNLLKNMAQHIDPSRLLLHPAQWFKFHWEKMLGIPYRVHQIEYALNAILDEGSRTYDNPNFGKEILQAIDDQNEVNHLTQLGKLNPSQARIASFLNQYWNTTRQIFGDPKLGPNPLISHMVDNYVPHIVLKDKDGNPLYDQKKEVWSRNSGFARQRVQDDITSTPIFRTLTHLEDQGYTVEWNPARIFAAHANSTFRMMQIKELTNTLKGTIYESPDGKFKSWPIVSIVKDKTGMSELDRLKSQAAKGAMDWQGLDIFDKPDARVRFGPGDSMFATYRVHPELARYVERLASMNDLKLPGMALARGLRWMGGLFKFIQFSINPRHAFNVFSNISNMYSPMGVMSPTIWKNIYGRANRAMLPTDRSTIYRAAHKGDLKSYNASLDESATIEKNMRSLFEAMQEAGFDPLDQNPNGSMTPREAALRDEYNQMRDDLIKEHQNIDEALSTRDRELAATLMQKGLVQDHDLIEGADLNHLSGLAEKIPGMAQFHRWMWRDVVWRGQVGLAMHLADSYIKKAAEKSGWDGTGGVTQAEQHVPADLLDGIHREAVYQAKQATGLLNKLDMSTNWQVYGRGLLVSAPWTMGQLQAARDSIGNNKFSQLLGRDPLNVSDRQLQSGFTKKKAGFLDDMHTALARRMVYAGTAKLLMTSMFLSTVGSWMLTGNINTPIQNFLMDPMHTFDIYGGRDPATQRIIWYDNPLYGFQHELANYVLAGLKAGMEGKNPIEIGAAPMIKFLNKENPTINLVLDMVGGIEMSRYMAGLDPSMKKDTDLQNLHAAMDQLGVPDFGSWEDRALYAIRTLSPSPGGFATTAVKMGPDGKPVKDELGNNIPLTDRRSILNDFGIGGFVNPAMDLINTLPIPISPNKGDTSYGTDSSYSPLQQLANLKDDIINPRLGLYAAGMSETESKGLYAPEVTKAGLQLPQDPSGVFPEQAQYAASADSSAQYTSRQMALIQIGNLAVQGTPDAYQQIGQLRNQYNLTDSQVVNAIEYQTTAVDSNGKVHQSPGLLGKRQPSSGIVTINGTDLTQQQSNQYNATKGQRQLYMMQQLQNDSSFKTSDTSTKAMMISQMVTLSDKFTTAQAGQQFLGTGGAPLTDSDFKTLMSSALSARHDIQAAVQFTPEYQNADPSQRAAMMKSYSTLADTVAWNKQFGNMKNLSNTDFNRLMIQAVETDGSVKNYLSNTPFYQGADAATQASIEKEYTGLARQMLLNIYSGKNTDINPSEVSTYMQAVVNTEETAKYLLHQSDFYQSASLSSQQTLDNKYTTYSRALALADWKRGTALLNLGNAAQAYQAGPEQLMVGRILAEQGLSDLQSQFGGSTAITAYEQQLADLKKQVKEQMVGSPAQITRMQTILAQNYEAMNPQYGNYLKARTAWERGTTVGRLYTALNADEQALATIDSSVITDSTGINVGSDLTQSIDTSTIMGGSDLTGANIDPSLVDPTQIDPSLVDPSQTIITDPNALG